MWNLKSVLSETLNLKWPVLRCVQYSNISKKCLLCLYELLKIVTYQNRNKLLNKRSELLCKCGHANRFLLKKYTSKQGKADSLCSYMLFQSWNKLIYRFFLLSVIYDIHCYFFYIKHCLVVLHYLRNIESQVDGQIEREKK